MSPRRFAALLGCAVVLSAGSSLADQPAYIDGGGVIHVPAFLLPESSLLAHSGRTAVSEPSRTDQKRDAAAWAACPQLEQAVAAQASAIRECEVGAFRASSPYRRLHDRYAVAVVRQEIGGVQTEVFTPARGVAARNHGRVLIDLHGGGFLGGWRINSDYESTPVASLGRIEVISVDYREAPEHRFPAASEDVAAVYQALLKSHKPASIGIYGCSAGALLTAEAIALFETKGLPLPGAVAMLCGGASYWSDGDSGYLGRAIYGDGVVFGTAGQNPYFRATTASNVLAFPVRSAAIMRRFPASLLITATRDPALSSAAYTHSVLVAEGVEAELHVWEGLGHGFFYDTGLPESRAAYGVIVRFFDTHLAVGPPDSR